MFDKSLSKKIYKPIDLKRRIIQKRVATLYDRIQNTKKQKINNNNDKNQEINTK
jgi:hypothetical protein